MFTKNRIEALSDGVFAITMTLLVLDLKIPEGTSPLQLGAAVRHGGHAWFSFVVTFVIACIFWTLPHRIFDLMEHMSHETLIPSFIFLFFVAILPFSTHILGNFVGDEPTITRGAAGHLFITAVTGNGKSSMIESTDGGATWSTPIRVDASVGDSPAFIPQIATRPDGTVAVQYYDLEHATAAQPDLTDQFIVTCSSNCSSERPGQAACAYEIRPRAGTGTPGTAVAAIG